MPDGVPLGDELRVNLCGEVKGVTPEAVAKASLNRALSRKD